MVNDLDRRTIRVFCPDHRLGFTVFEGPHIMCVSEQHALGQDFPYDTFWEYCCDCRTYCPSKTGQRHDNCFSCELAVARRYLCDQCHTMSLECDGLTKRRDFRIPLTDDEPFLCPGCLQVSNLVPIEHQCGEVPFSYRTARATCLFCDEILREKIAEGTTKKNTQRETRTISVAVSGDAKKIAVSFPISVVKCLVMSQTSLKVVRRDIARAILVTGPDGKGELALIRNPSLSKNSDSLFVIPRITRFLSADTFNNLYKKYYDCAKPVAGDVWIIDPAVVSQVEGGWQLVKKGVLEVRARGGEKGPVHLNVEPEVVEIDHEQGPQVSAPSVPLVKWQLRIVLGIIASLVLLTAVIMGILRGPQPPTANNNAQATPSPSIKMIRIEGGEFQMGNDAGDGYEKPAHKVNVKPFLMDVNEVTCEEYQKFVNTTNHRIPRNWISGQYPNGAARKPVTGVDWDDATAYARWAGKRLPTEEEWEFAARGTDHRRYPWGDSWRPGEANADGASSALADVGAYNGASPFKVYDMVGNAWEWTASKLVAYPGGRLPDEPSGDLRVIRGGSWQSDKDSATTTYRWGWPARGGKDYRNTGFRCAKDVTLGPSRTE